MTQKQIRKTDVAAVLPKRAAGILCHLSSIPGPHFNGDLTFAACKKFIDWLRSAGQSYWQVLPLNPIGSGNSPYSSVCSFAGDPIFISLTDLANEGLLDSADIRKLPKPARKTVVNYNLARKQRLVLLQKAFQKFRPNSSYQKFVQDQASWLEDYALYSAITEIQGTSQWNLWPKGLRTRDRLSLEAAKSEHGQKIEFYKFLQYCFFAQWQRVKSYANRNKVKVIGDIPIFVSHESSDVWGSQANFILNADGSPKFVAGVPPDYFNAEGQLWGNALFDWSYMKKDGFTWWLRRLSHMSSMFDLVRLDHFIGFYRYWAIPAGSNTAKQGSWKLAEGDALLSKFQEQFGHLPFIAEDLGLVTKEVTALREKYNLPAMKVLQLAFGNDDSAPIHVPHNFDNSNCVVYTGTHDNDTTAGWYASAKRESKRTNPSYNFPFMKAYICNQDSPHWSLAADAFKSIAQLAIIPLQDVFGLGSSARMNIPGTIGKNWDWRADASHFKSGLAKDLHSLTKATDRL